MYINMYQQKEESCSLLFRVLFQFDWQLGEPDKFGHGSTPYYIPPSGILFTIWRFRRWVHLSFEVRWFRQYCYDTSVWPLNRVYTFTYYTQKVVVYGTPPYQFGCMHFRLNLLLDVFPVVKYLFTFPRVSISPAYTHSIRKCPDSQYQNCFPRQFLLFFTRIQIFEFDFGLFSASHQYDSGYSIPLVVFHVDIS